MHDGLSASGLLDLLFCVWSGRRIAPRLCPNGALLAVAGEWRLQPVEQAGRPELAEEIFGRARVVYGGGWLVSGRVVNGLGLCGRRMTRARGALGMRRIV